MALMVLASLIARPAQAEVIEQIAAIVNDEAIFLSDIRGRAAPYFSQVFDAPTQTERMARLEQLYGEVLTHLVDQELLRQAAVRMQVRVTSAEIDEAVANMRRRAGLDEEAFRAALTQEGMSVTRYRGELRQQLVRLKVMNQRVRGRVNIAEEDVRERYEQRLRQATRQVRFRASHIFLPLAPGAGATQWADVMQRARSLHEELSDGTRDFAETVAEVGGGELGWLSQGDLPEQLDNALTALESGTIAEPVRGPSGVHIFFLHERERGGAEIPPYAQVRQEIYREILDVAMRQQETIFMNELREEAIIDRRIGEE